MFTTIATIFYVVGNFCIAPKTRHGESPMLTKPIAIPSKLGGGGFPEREIFLGCVNAKREGNEDDDGKVMIAIRACGSLRWADRGGRDSFFFLFSARCARRCAGHFFAFRIGKTAFLGFRPPGEVD